MTLEPIPEPWLDPDQITYLNKLFYGTETSDYFASRLGMLVVAAAKPEIIEEAIRQGVSFDVLELGSRPGDNEVADDPESDEADHQRFVITEALSLLYHVSETLMRMYFAHAQPSGCSWIEVASERRPDIFKEKVRQRFDARPLDAGRRTAIARVFYGTRHRPDSISESDWAVDVQNLDRWLNHFARLFRSDAHIWNALKHGLAIQSGEPMMTIGEIETVGPGVTYLEKPDKRWRLSTKWINQLGYVMGEIYIANRMLSTIWQVGRRRYLGDTQPIQVYTGPPYDDFIKPAKSGGPVTTIRADILYLWAFQRDTPCSSCGRQPPGSEGHPKTWRMYSDAEETPHILCQDCAARHEAV